MQAKTKLNIAPLMGDFALLVLAFFITIIIVQQLKIIKSEETMEIPSDTYFNTSEYSLNENKRSQLKMSLEDSIFSKIEKYFNVGRLQMVRIEGHTDDVQPDPKIERIWKTNRELSLLRANTVTSLLEEIAEERIEDNKIESFKSKLFPGGYGEYRSIPPGTLGVNDWRTKNRRIEIQLIVK